MDLGRTDRGERRGGNNDQLLSADGGHEQVRLTNDDGTTRTEGESVLVHHDPGHGIVAGQTSPFSGEGKRLVVVVPRGTDRTTPSVIRLHRVERRR
ncbi:hypothetical protein ABZU76_01070 [Amycolatopsis sp. NPDC005232]|uniref:hypothetical protein n=1 Tax=Amycolatopsis sp. NPDC005232 TaxID=3157027 RepID=UPI0033BE0E6C